MPYPLSAAVVKKAYDTLSNDITQLKTTCLAVQAATAGGVAAPLWTALRAAQAAISYRTDFTLIASNVPLRQQLVPYVQTQVAGASALDVTTEYTTLNTLCMNLLNALAQDYPHNGQNVLLDRTFNFTTGEVWLNFTANQAPNFMPAVAALLDAIT